MSRALIKFIRLSPTKARLIAREIQGMNAELAMASLKFMPNKGARYIANAISSAVANGGFEANEVEVLSCRVDVGGVLKRFQPRARGSASRIRKPTSHILVVVGKADEKANLQKPAKASAKPKKPESKAVANSAQGDTKPKQGVKNSTKATNKATTSEAKKAEKAPAKKSQSAANSAKKPAQKSQTKKES